jgi:acetyl esterase/lipase
MLDTLMHLPQPLRDAAYNNTAAVHDSARQLAAFEARSAALVKQVPAQLDMAYGTAERMRFDFFRAAADMPTLLFIHGGYWQMRHKNTFRFVVDGALGRGLNAALIGYTLAPQASLTRIVAEVKKGIAAVRAHAVAQGGTGDILLCGWSAGGHLTAMGLSCEGVMAGLGLSGIYDLAPLQHTYLNDALQLTESEVRTLSPISLPLMDKPFVTAYGTAELQQLRAQSQAFAEYRGTVPFPVEGADHFSILDALALHDGCLLECFLAAAEA